MSMLLMLRQEALVDLSLKYSVVQANKVFRGRLKKCWQKDTKY